MEHAEPPKPEQKEVTGAYEEFQSKGEDFGYGLTPPALDTEPTPTDLLQASAAYALAALGSGTEVQNFRKVSDEPETWQARVVNGDQSGILTARRVPGGYDLKVKSNTVQGIYD